MKNCVPVFAGNQEYCILETSSYCYYLQWNMILSIIGTMLMNVLLWDSNYPVVGKMKLIFFSYFSLLIWTNNLWEMGHVNWIHENVDISTKLV